MLIEPPTDKPAKSYARLRDRAYRLLARREHSAWELRRKLLFANSSAAMARGARKINKPDPDEVDQVIFDLTECDLQSDLRFAEQHCRRRFQAGRGPIKLRHELTSHGIAEDTIVQVMAEYESKWQALADEVRTRKFGDAPTSYKEWAKQARFLQQRGFSNDHIARFDGG